MFTIFKIVKKLLNYLNANEKIENIALSITFSIIYALIPFNPLFHAIFLFLLIILNGNLLFFLFLTPFFFEVLEFIYPINHLIGNLILSSNNLLPLFESIYTIPLLNYLNWNNTVSLGGYLLSILFFIPIYKINILLITIYRKSILPKFNQSKLSKIFKFPSWMGPQ